MTDFRSRFGLRKSVRPKEVEGDLELRVHKVQQAASGGNHVTIYDADVEIFSGGVGVQVHGTEPRDALPGVYQWAIESIKNGAEQVLSPISLGAVIRITRIVLHPVDFKPRKFEQYTTKELSRLVRQWQAKQEISDNE